MARIFKIARKARGYKLTGEKSQDMCNGCKSFGCDPMCDSPAWTRKKAKRSDRGQCVSCGCNPCKCRSTNALPRKKESLDVTSLKNKPISNMTNRELITIANR